MTVETKQVERAAEALGQVGSGGEQGGAAEHQARQHTRSSPTFYYRRDTLRVRRLNRS